MKATHDGNCQLCGRLQRLPFGKLAQHGYTVYWGFFSGTCPGSFQLPFQQSKDLIDGSITGQLRSIEGAKQAAAELRDPLSSENGGSTAWVNQYVSSTRHGAVFEWHKVALTHVAQSRGAGDDAFIAHSYTYVGRDGKPARLDYVPYGILADPKAVVLWANEKRALAVFDKEVAQRTGYVSWLRLRIKSWKPEPLINREP